MNNNLKIAKLENFVSHCFDLFGEMLDDPRVMHGEASGDIITTAAQLREEVSPLSMSRVPMQ